MAEAEGPEPQERTRTRPHVGQSEEFVPRFAVDSSIRLVGCHPPGLCGGDEETRTPDPLLAKEMLFQLSYVPTLPDGRWWAFLDSNQRPLPYQGSALTS